MYQGIHRNSIQTSSSDLHKSNQLECRELIFSDLSNQLDNDGRKKKYIGFVTFSPNELDADFSTHI